MTRRDQGIVGALIGLFAVLAILISLPSAAGGPGAVAEPSGERSPTGSSPSPLAGPASEPGLSPGTAIPSSSEDPGRSGGPVATGPPLAVIRHGVLGNPTSINPLTARTQPDRDLVALVFSGLVRLGADDTVLPDLADRWSVDKTGAHWTFHIRSTALWHDGRAVTADDVVFTVKLLRDAAYTGPFARSWSEITVRKLDARTVRFDLKTPLGDFLQLARQPLLPWHLLRRVPIQGLVDSAFSAAPVGAGPYRLLQWDGNMALLQPANVVASPGTTGPGPTAPPVTPPRLQLMFYPTVEALAAAYRAGEIDMANGLPAAVAKELDRISGTRVIRYPRSTLTAVLFNLRTNHPTIRDQQVRQALLRAIDRDKLVQDVLAGLGKRADSLIPPTSWAYVARAARPMGYRTALAAQLLKAAGWRKVSGEWHAPGSNKPFAIELITTTMASNPVTWAAAQFVAESWRSFGITVKVVALAPNLLVGRRLSQANFTAAVVDINIGLDPDLYPLLASRQTGIGGSNLSGLQSLALDDLLIAARKPGTIPQRRGAWAKLEAYLAKAQVTLPLAFRDDPLVVSKRVTGPASHLEGDLSDRFWDVLTWRLASGG